MLQDKSFLKKVRLTGQELIADHGPDRIDNIMQWNKFFGEFQEVKGTVW